MMKFVKTFNGLFLLILFPALLLAFKDECPYSLDKFNLDVDEESIVIKSVLMPGTTVRINEDFQLFINGQRIELNEEEQLLVAQYYKQAMSLILNAKKIGIESARFALKAVVKMGSRGIYAAILSLFDEPDAEEHLENAEKEIEEQAEQIERKGHKLEKMADRLEFLHCRLFSEVKALQQLLVED